MSNVTSLSLLKGAKAAELGEELEKPDAVPVAEAPAEETVSVDVDTMSSDELDALVTEHGVEVPEEWPTLNDEAKRNWLKSEFEEAPAAEAVQSVEVAQVEEEKPDKKKASKSKAVPTRAETVREREGLTRSSPSCEQIPRGSPGPKADASSSCRPSSKLAGRAARPPPECASK